MSDGWRASSAIGPLLLRLVVGVTFVWAGLGKLLPRVEFDAAEVAALRSMGMRLPGDRPPTGPGSSGGVRPGPGAATGAGSASPPPAGTEAPVPRMQPPSVPLPVPSDAPAPGRGSALPAPAPASPEPMVAARVQRQANPSPARPAPQPAARPLPAGPDPLGQPTSGAVLRNVYKLALLLYSRSEITPALPTDDIRHPVKLWPVWLGSGGGGVVAAWTVALLELAAGAALAWGLFTRAAAGALLAVIAGAVWLTQIGPAIWSGSTWLGVIPAHASWWDFRAYATLLWQLALGAMLLSLLFSGAGPLSLDRAVFQGSGRDRAGQPGRGGS